MGIQRMRMRFDAREWEEIHSYLKEWDEWRRKKPIGRPDFTSDAIFTVPLAICMLKSARLTERLTACDSDLDCSIHNLVPVIVNSLLLKPNHLI